MSSWNTYWFLITHGHLWAHTLYCGQAAMNDWIGHVRDRCGIYV